MSKVSLYASKSILQLSHASLPSLEVLLEITGKKFFKDHLLDKSRFLVSEKSRGLQTWLRRIVQLAEVENSIIIRQSLR